MPIIPLHHRLNRPKSPLWMLAGCQFAVRMAARSGSDLDWRRQIRCRTAVPTPFTPACDGHPLAPIAGPIVMRGAKSGDVVAIDHNGHINDNPEIDVSGREAARLDISALLAGFSGFTINADSGSHRASIEDTVALLARCRATTECGSWWGWGGSTAQASDPACAIPERSCIDERRPRFGRVSDWNVFGRSAAARRRACGDADRQHVCQRGCWYRAPILRHNPRSGARARRQGRSFDLV